MTLFYFNLAGIPSISCLGIVEPRRGRSVAVNPPPRISFSVGCLQAAADTFVII
ncbi:hypothetical protein [Microcystis aeruginosa]|uniref:Uncharacterized protein n=1 Tax=Microcystis aeruginosa NIES-3807 TaxID=2517785 RepID=A0AAD3AZH8_MICAE|nr:hypothetical protein [Microcystis aeruginosa]GCL58755.1 hypothetical protein NIES3807_19250 [Microcystis aeruginosa NIES-3807]